MTLANGVFVDFGATYPCPFSTTTQGLRASIDRPFLFSSLLLGRHRTIIRTQIGRAAGRQAESSLPHTGPWKGLVVSEDHTELTLASIPGWNYPGSLVEVRHFDDAMPSQKGGLLQVTRHPSQENL